MRFMMMVKADEKYEAGQPPNPELMAEMGRFTEEMMKAGVVLELGGLLPSFAGARVNAAGGELTVTDGPFTETKELIGGFAIIQADSKQQAIEHAKQFMSLHTKVIGPGYVGECEIRQMFEPAKCGEGR